MSCELDKVISIINEAVGEVYNSQARKELNELKSDLTQFAVKMQSNNEVKDISRLLGAVTRLKKAEVIDNKKTPVLDTVPNYVNGQKNMTYAGVGSRETPPEILAEMTKIANELAAKKYKLQSGGAIGADMAFEGKEYPKILKALDKDIVNKQGKVILKAGESVTIGSKEFTEAYYAYSSKDSRGLFSVPEYVKATPTSNTTSFSAFNVKDSEVDKKALEIAKELHPKFENLKSSFAKNLMARNNFQVFGKNLDTPVDFVLFYAKESNNPLRPEGGTGQAVEAARRKGIPTINMAEDGWRARLNDVLAGNVATSIPNKKLLTPDLNSSIELDDKSTSNIKVIKATGKSMTEIEKGIVKLINESAGVVTTANGTRKALWLGPVEYSYSGVTHGATVATPIITKLSNAASRATGKPEGYFNSVLINQYTSSKGLKSHSDNEDIFRDDHNEIGEIVTMTVKGSGTITVTNKSTKKTETVITNTGDMYIMPGGKFQDEHTHGVETNGERISLTFRHVPKNRLPSKEDRNKDSKESSNTIDINFDNKSEDKLLSNLAYKPFEYYGTIFESVEHAYQSLKTGKLNEAVYLNTKWGLVRSGKYPIKVNGGIPNTKNNANIVLMEDLMRESFRQNPKAQEVLERTKGHTLSHVRGDKVWSKEFPRILTEIRDTKKIILKEDPKSTEPITEVQGLTTGQSKAYKEILEVLESDKEHLYLLEGPGGTGKSYVVGEILKEHLKGIDGKRGSVKIMAAATAHAAKNIIGDFVEKSIKDLSKDDQFRIETTRAVAIQLPRTLSKLLDSRKKEKDLIVILDEVSMVSPLVVNGLKEYVTQVNNSGAARVKLIMLGDRAQLRPVFTPKNPRQMELTIYRDGKVYVENMAFKVRTENGVSGLVGVPFDIFSGKVNNNKLLVTNLDGLRLKSGLFRNSSGIRGTTLLENMRNPKLATMFDKFRTGDNEVLTTVEAENDSKFTKQYDNALNELKKFTVDGEKLVIDIATESVSDNTELLKSWIAGKTAVVAFKNDTVASINKDMTYLAGRLEGKSDDVSKYGLFVGQSLKSTANIVNSYGPNEKTTKLTNNTTVDITELYKATKKGATGHILPVFEGETLFEVARENFFEDDKSTYAYGIRLNIDNLSDDIRSKVNMANVRFPNPDDKQNYMESSIVTSLSYDLTIGDLLYKYGEFVQMIYTDDGVKEIGSTDINLSEDKLPTGISMIEYKMQLSSADYSAVNPVYAMTAHKSQGTTLDNVIVIEDWKDNQYLTKVAKLELMYVAISRSAGKIVLAGNRSNMLLSQVTSSKANINGTLSTIVAIKAQGC